MPSYVMLANWTDQGVRRVTDLPKRIDNAKKLLGGMGGQFNSHNESLGMLFPFTLAWLLVILLVAFVPDLVLWLPRMMQGHN